MINRIAELWQTLDEKQQLYALVSATALALLLLIMLLYLPLKLQNQTLESQLKTQLDLREKMINVGKNSDDFLPVNLKGAKSAVEKAAKQNRLDIKLQTNDNNKLVLTLKNQEFSALIDLLLSVRKRYAITASQANIRKIKAGFVDASLTLILP